MNNYQTIIVEKKKCALWIRLNRPKYRNAINRQMYRELIDVLKHANTDPDVALTVITGEGEFYSSGNDFSPNELAQSMDAADPRPIFAELTDALIDHEKPLIACVNGPAIGIACTTLALFELVIASDRAYFMTPFPQFGLVPEGCSSVSIPQMIGYTKACQMLMFGETMSAQDALQCGFVARLVPHDQFRRVTEVLIDGYADFVPSSQLISKRLLRDQQQTDRLHECNQREANAVTERFTSDDVMTRLMRKFAKNEKPAAKL